MKQFKFKSIFHTLVAIVIPCLIFYYSHLWFVNQVKPKVETCLYVGISCIIEKGDGFTNANISKIDPKSLVLNTRVVYNTITVEEQIHSFNICMIFAMLFLAILLRFPLEIIYIMFSILKVF